MSPRRIIKLIVLLLALLIVACAPQAEEPDAEPPIEPTVKPETEPTVEPETEPTIEPTAEAQADDEEVAAPVLEEEYPAAVLAARRSLGQSIGLPADQVEIVSYEEVEWPDACLGLARADERCAQAVTPGWRVILNAEGQQFEYHTDQRGKIIRRKETMTDANQSYPEAVRAAVQRLSQSLDMAADQIRVISYQQVEWPDACLGLASADEMCAQVITPGWEVTLEAAGRSYEVHTNMTGSSVRWR